jgi:hypothetical protein
MNGLSQQWWMQAGLGSLPDDPTAHAWQKSLDRKDFYSAARFSVLDAFLV